MDLWPAARDWHRDVSGMASLTGWLLPVLLFGRVSCAPAAVLAKADLEMLCLVL